MAKKALNNNFHNASKVKEDEFYTQLSDIERELKYYKKHFKNKVFTAIVTTQELVISFTTFRTTFKN